MNRLSATTACLKRPRSTCPAQPNVRRTRWAMRSSLKSPRTKAKAMRSITAVGLVVSKTVWSAWIASMRV